MTGTTHHLSPETFADDLHSTVPVAGLNAWNLGQQACDCTGVYAEPDPHRNGQGPNLRWGTYLCRVVHENEFRYGTFLGYHNQADCKLQTWGHFRPPEGWEPLALTGRPIQDHPHRTTVLAGDLTFHNLTRNSGHLVWPEHVDSKPVEISGKLILIDHIIGLLTGEPETVLWYSNAAYEAALPRHDRMLPTRVRVPATTGMYFDHSDTFGVQDQR